MNYLALLLDIAHPLRVELIRIQLIARMGNGNGYT